MSPHSLVHCQVLSSRQCCGSPLKRNSNPFSCTENLGLSRTTSLPERDILQREALVYSSLIQTSSSSLSSSDTFGDGGMRGGEKHGRGGREGSMASNTSSFTLEQFWRSGSRPADEDTWTGRTRDVTPFLLNTEDEDDDEDEANLNGYLKTPPFTCMEIRMTSQMQHLQMKTCRRSPAWPWVYRWTFSLAWVYRKNSGIPLMGLVGKQRAETTQ